MYGTWPTKFGSGYTVTIYLDSRTQGLVNSEPSELVLVNVSPLDHTSLRAAYAARSTPRPKTMHLRQILSVPFTLHHGPKP